jgi:hypothetical protein
VPVVTTRLEFPVNDCPISSSYSRIRSKKSSNIFRACGPAGKRIFAVMRERYPTKYFDALVSLAKVHRIELGPPGAFDRPQTKAEALDRLEQRVARLIEGPNKNEPNKPGHHSI